MWLPRSRVVEGVEVLVFQLKISGKQVDGEELVWMLVESLHAALLG